MIYHEQHPPAGPLAPFIQTYWYWEGEDPGHAKDAIVASSRMGLLINLRRDDLSWYSGDGFAAHSKLKGMALRGTHAQAFAIDARQPHMMGVQFWPGGAFPFFRPPASELSNRFLSLEDLWGADAERLYQRLVQAPTPQDKFAILERALLAAAPRDLGHHPAVATALARLRRCRDASVASLAKEAEVSHKRFIRLFTEEMGVAPKLFLRMRRFRRLLDAVWRRPSVDWAEEAFVHGYYDQPHLIREFHEFSGFTPTDYMRRRGPYSQHIPLSA